jgi:uncharacterized protein (DUF885 family)
MSFSGRLTLAIVFLASLSILFSRCGQPTTAPATPGAADSAFYRLADTYLQGSLDWRPQLGVSLGFHQYDNRITDCSKASINAELQRLKDVDSKLGAIDTASLSSRGFIDYRLLWSDLQSSMFSIGEMRAYWQNPMTYTQAVDVNAYIKRDFAPLQDRLRSIIAVEKQLPGMYADAKANLDDSLPKPLIQTAIEISKGNAGFLRGDLVTALAPVKNDSLMAAFRTANQAAVGAINDYIHWLQTDRLPKSNERYALGEEKYRKFLAINELTDLSPERVLDLGLAELKRQQDAFNVAAHVINPRKAPVEVYHDMEKEHPTADSLIPDSRRHVEAIRQFLLDHQIISMPSEVRVLVKETPPYARETSTASNDDPGPFETKATEAYYYITPVNEHWTAKQKEDWLASFNYYTTDVVTIHEAYPGHYTQYLHLKASDANKFEKIFSNYAFVEGWAHYTEQMMLDQGYGNNGDSVKAAKYRLAQAGDALLRVCRLCVSVKMHCQGMTLEQGKKFFMDNWYQGEEPSRLEALRGTFDPGYLFYTLGKLEILKLRADYQRQEGSQYSLKAFNDAMVDHGQPPIRLLREILLKDRGEWGKPL